MTKRTLVTGATGLIGFNLAKKLCAEGHEVRAASRSASGDTVPEGTEPVPMDVCDAQSVASAMKTCDRVFHCAGVPEKWLRDPSLFSRVHVEGTNHVLDAARAQGLERLIYLSTIDVFLDKPGLPFDEDMLDGNPKATTYERSKQEADQLVAAYPNRPHTVFVHPAAVYGPGPAGSAGVNQLLSDLRDGKMPALLPGGMPLVHCEDLAEGICRAADKDDGERFIFADKYYSLQEIAAVLASVCPSAKVPRTMPNWAASAVSTLGEGLAKVVRRPPLVPRGQLHFLRQGSTPSSIKAQQILDWKTRPLAQGVRETLESWKS